MIRALILEGDERGKLFGTAILLGTRRLAVPMRPMALCTRIAWSNLDLGERIQFMVERGIMGQPLL